MTTDGKTTIAPDVLLTIARLATLQVDGVSRMCSEPFGMSRIFQRKVHQGVRIEIEDDKVNADIYVIMKRDINIRDVSRNIQQSVSRAISEMVGMEIGRVDIHIEDMDYSEENEVQAA